jgi:hypothetical protein
MSERNSFRTFQHSERVPARAMEPLVDPAGWSPESLRDVAQWSYRLTDADVQEIPISVASFLIVHPRGVLLWDAGAVADHERGGDIGFDQRLVRRDGAERFVKLGKTR